MRRALLVALIAALAGCGSPAAGHHAAAQHRPAHQPPALLDGCAAQHASPPRDAVAGGEQLPLVMLGNGADTVVLSDESDENLCSWLGFARRLAAGGYRVVLWDYLGEPAVTELSAVVAAAGGRRVILIGASEGAKASLIAAARLRPAPLAVVSLSAEAELRGMPVAPSVHRLPCPALLVTSATDPYGSASAAAAFLTTAPRGRAVLYTVPGDAHGIALLTPAVQLRIIGFLRSTAQ